MNQPATPVFVFCLHLQQNMPSGNADSQPGKGVHIAHGNKQSGSAIMSNTAKSRLAKLGRPDRSPAAGQAPVTLKRPSSQKNLFKAAAPR